MRLDVNKEKKIDNFCCEKVANKSSFILRRQQVMYKHLQNFSLTRLRNQMSFENEILHRCLFLLEVLSENKSEPREHTFKLHVHLV